MALQVIGTGFGRTGTDSMREALDILGFGPCHHMLEVIGNDHQKQLWRAVAKGAAPGWNELFTGYSSCVDWPSAHYWRDLVRVYPEARVILTNRSPESWWASFEKTILPVVMNSVDQDSLRFGIDRQTGFRRQAGRPRTCHRRLRGQCPRCHRNRSEKPLAGSQSRRRLGAVVPTSRRACTGRALSQPQQHC